MRWFIKAIPAAQHAIVIVAIAAIVVTAYFVSSLVVEQHDVIEQQRDVLERQERVLEHREAEIAEDRQVRTEAVRKAIRRINRIEGQTRAICAAIPECDTIGE